MRSYNAAGFQLVGAAAAAALLVFFNQPQPVSATTEASAPTGARSLDGASASNPAAQAPVRPSPVGPAPVVQAPVGGLPARKAPAIQPLAVQAPATEAAPGAAAPASPQIVQDKIVQDKITLEKSADEKSEAKPAETAAAPEKPKPLPVTLVARINLTSQTMVVQAGNKTIHTWKVSTGAPGYATPPGSFKPSWMAQMWRSRQYDDAPMPYSVFFNGGIAVHGTMNPGSLGSARSHGCVRLATSNAATFFKLVNRHGMAQTRIIVHGKQPFGNSQMIASRSSNRQARAANAWIYADNSNASRAAARAAASRYDSYGYQPSYRAQSRTQSQYRARTQHQPQGQPRRVSAIRSQSTYWSQ